MKFFHLADLHIGKRLNEFSLLEDQQAILAEILAYADEERPDAVLIAGDVYDRPVPPAEAVSVFDAFVTGLADKGVKVFVISGNHDSADRMAFGAHLMSSRGVWFSPVYDGIIEPVVLSDEFGPLSIWMIPFLKPATVRAVLPETDCSSYDSAFRAVVETLPLDRNTRNVAVAHQFLTGSVRCDSEEVSVGGLDQIGASAFEGFDYAALGHLHTAQSAGAEYVRYCGTPLKYSFSEAKDDKTLSVVELRGKGNVSVRKLPLHPLRDLREISGTYEELTDRRKYEGTPTGDYLHITLTDEEEIPEAMARLQTVYPNAMKLDYKNLRTGAVREIGQAENPENKTPLELFGELFEKQNNRGLTEAEQAFLTPIIEKIWRPEE
ncbi:MAG TPA: exonuclease SbcCD subunit D [Oscillospiraceae bacterium]|nr:exonuclease SbcCD subunit D [Oscillospiraceae bacterium]